LISRPILVHRFRRLGNAGPSIPQLLVQAAARYGVDSSLVMAIAQRESNFRSVVNPQSGACGVMQLLPATARAYGASNCLDPVQNIDAGVHLLSDLITQFGGDLAKAVAAYDWGSGNLSKAIAQWGDDWFSHAPGETQAYVSAIVGAPAGSSPLTIDASTGLPIDDSTPTPAVAAGLVSTSPSTTGILGLTAALFGGYLLLDLLTD
jgi:soluble lytic murein transglycosylase-like protein